MRRRESGYTYILQPLQIVLLRKNMHGDAQLGWVEAALLCLVRMPLIVLVVVAGFDKRCFFPI